jgi:hypothetical protein
LRGTERTRKTQAKESYLSLHDVYLFVKSTVVVSVNKEKSVFSAQPLKRAVLLLEKFNLKTKIALLISGKE